MSNTLIEQPVPQSLKRWRGAVGINWKGLALVGDAFSNVIGVSDFGAFTEYGETMRFLITTPPVHEDRKRIFVSRFEIEVEAGQGFPSEDSPSITTTYCANPIVMTSPTTMATAGALANLPATFYSFWHSMWLFIPDGANASGIILTNQDDATLGSTNPGLFIKVANDVTANPQVVVDAWDAAGAPIVAATFNFGAWGAWTNVIVSLDTATQQIGVWTSTLVGGHLIDQALAPVALSWSSTHPISNPAGHPWRVLTVGS